MLLAEPMQYCSLVTPSADMLTAYIHSVTTENPGLEDPAGTRDRLKDRFPRGATRRMTQLGLLIGAVLDPLNPTESDTLVYASEFAESRALEGYLDSFPGASPTLFQTSIHPSAVQQWLIQRQQAIRTFFPMTGSQHLVAQSLLVALLDDAPRRIFCGGDERGTWLLEARAASPTTFAFALALTSQSEGALGEISLASVDRADGELSLQDFFHALCRREPLALPPCPGQWLTLTWR